MRTLHPGLSILRRLLELHLVYILFRLLFLFVHRAEFEGTSVGELFSVFLYGLRFDSSIIFSLNLPIMIMGLLPFAFARTQAYSKVLRFLYILLNAPLLILGLIDVEFYKFTGRRTTVEIFRISQDIADQSGQILINYWYISLIGFLIPILWWVYERGKRESFAHSVRFFKETGVWILAVVISILMIRNSFQSRPLASGHAFAFSRPALGQLALNTPFVFVKSIQSSVEEKPVHRVSYFKSQEEALKQIQPPSSSQRPLNKQNVVLIILESFGSEYLGAGNSYPGYTPFLDGLAAKGLHFTNYFANAKRSIEALPSVLASIPNLMEGSFIMSVYQSNTIFGLAHDLRRHGYSTAFFHAAKNGSMGFDYFSKQTGFQKYWGLNEYKNEHPDYLKDHDGNWGIYDEPYLQYFKSKLSQMPEPFMGAVFTLTSHQPYPVPHQYKNRFPKGTDPVHACVGYVDYALKRFFDEASKEPWFKNTLFVITADHTHHNIEKAYTTELGRYDIPLILYHPSQKLPTADTARIAEQIDILPSVLDYLGIDSEKQFPFGRSVFGKDEGVAILRSAGLYTLVHKDYYLTYSDEAGSKLYSFEPLFGKSQQVNNQGEIQKRYESEIKAYIQLFNNGLEENNWYVKSK